MKIDSAAAEKESLYYSEVGEDDTVKDCVDEDELKEIFEDFSA